MCGPIGDESTRAHRPLRHLAERLAAQGFPVLRFDYRGTGDSSGDELQPARVPGWVEDVGLAADELRARSGVASVSLVGLRIGATLAAVAASRRSDVASVVLWSAFGSGASFVEDAVRIHRLHKRLDPQGFSGGPARGDGEESLGFFFTDETIVDLRAIDLGLLERAPAPRILIVGSDDRSDTALTERFSSLGAHAECQLVPMDKFLVVPPHQGALPEEALTAIVRWTDEAHPDRAQAGPAPDRALRVTPIEGEEPHIFGTDRPLFGMLGRPRRSRPELPALVLLNAGCVSRVGPHRQYVAMARRWRDLGFWVLRLDLSGIGDSPVAPGSPENLTYPPRGLEDIDQALQWLSREAEQASGQPGFDRVVLIGLCSGADMAFAAAGDDDERIAGLVLLNPRTFLVHDLATVESFKGARWYQDALGRKDAWMKLLRGQVDVGRAVRTLAPKLGKMVGQRLRTLVSPHDEGAPLDVPARLRAFAHRGVDTLLVVAPHDPGIDYVDATFPGPMAALKQLSGFRRIEVDGTDHTFTALWAQERVSDLITRHLFDRFVTHEAPLPHRPDDDLDEDDGPLMTPLPELAGV